MRTFRTLVITLILVSLLACSKGGEQTSAKEQSLLAYLPASTVVFARTDSSTAGFQKWKKSAWGELGNTLQDLSMNMMKSAVAGAPTTAQGPLVLLQALQKSGLISFFGGQQDAAKEMLSYSSLGSAPGSVYETAYYFTAAAGTSLKEKFGVIENLLKAEGLTPTRGTSTVADNFSVTFNNEPTGLPVAQYAEMWNKVFVYATADKLAIANTEASAQRLFAAAPDGAFLASPAYKAAEKYLFSPTGGDVASSYFDVKSLMKAASGFVPANSAAEFEKNLNQAPIGAIAGYMTMDDHPVVTYAMPLQPTTDAQKESLAILKQAGDMAVAKGVPSSALLLLALDGAAIKGAKNSILAEMPAEEQQKAAPQLALLDSVQGIGLGVANATGTSPFPEVFLLASSSSADQLHQTVMALAQAGSAQSGMPGSPWQKKDVAGVSVDYMLTPLGVGLFIGDVNGTVFVSSSESMALNIIEATKDSSKGLMKAIPDFAAGQKGRLFAAYLNFVKLFDLIQSVQGSMAMFTGGQSAMDMTKFEVLKKLGSGNAQVIFADDAIKAVVHLRAS